MTEQDERAWADNGLEQQYLAAGLAATHSHKDTHMRIQDMMESKYIKQSDVDGETPVTVQKLTRVNVARDDEPPEYKWTVKFAEFTKPMVLNVTNLKRMGKALGDDTDDWTGNTVILYVDDGVEFAGETVGGLRIKSMPKKSGNGNGKRPTDDDVNRKLRDAEPDDGSPPF